MEHYFTNNSNLKSEFRTIIYNYGDFHLEFTSDLGVFSKDRVDFGSRLLMETYFKYGKSNVSLLDVGCGYGIIGISISKVMNTKSTLVDINKRAVHLANINIKKLGVDAKAFESNIYDSVLGTFDVIVTNPPIRAGKQTVTSFLVDAKDHLNENGELWFVMRKDQGAKSMIEKLKDVYTFVNILEKSKGFFIIVAKND